MVETRTINPLKTAALAAHHVTSQITIKRGLFRSPDTQTLLDDVSVEIPSGSVFGIVGGPDSGASTLVGVLSGDLLPDQGEVQRGDGCIWFADQPTRHKLEEHLAAKPHEQTVVFASADAAMAQRLCDEVLLLREGRVLAAGAPRVLVEPLPGSVHIELVEQLELSASQQVMLDLWALPTVTRVVPVEQQSAGSVFEIVCTDPELVIDLVRARVRQSGWTVRALGAEMPRLADMFRLPAPRSASRSTVQSVSDAAHVGFGWNIATSS